ncbi:MAG: C_GCAxxG_C_C family protein [Candidatus Cloacimonetes bacterium]|nr:C_GCAxxG_C_C family protein [Candidatus Cloacimonadota bacterium]
MAGVLDQAFDYPLELEEHASIPLAGGIMQNGYQCGMIWGATLAAGAQAFRLYGPGPQTEAKAITAAQRLVKAFHANSGEIDCFEITDIDKSSSTMKMIYVFLIKGKTIGCMRMSAKFAKIALKEINTVLSEKNTKAPSPPVSCAAVLAEKMGASELQTVMAAGFAGGIGLCGGGCGALGAAIWIHGINKGKEPDSKIDFNDPEIAELIEKFLKSSDYEFECSAIVGRKFENIEDHANYIRDGGCSEIIDALAKM